MVDFFSHGNLTCVFIYKSFALDWSYTLTLPLYPFNVVISVANGILSCSSSSNRLVSCNEKKKSFIVKANLVLGLIIYNLYEDNIIDL